MKRDEILQNAVKELEVLAETAGKTLSDKTLKSLFIRKKAYQKDWPQKVLREKASLIVGATVLAIGDSPTMDELSPLLNISQK